VGKEEIRYKEDVTPGLENAIDAFIGMLDGKNFGKAIVKVAD
jgi:NADPH-dependent curcumin reductase CurA